MVCKEIMEKLPSFMDKPGIGKLSETVGIVYDERSTSTHQDPTGKTSDT